MKFDDARALPLGRPQATNLDAELVEALAHDAPLASDGDGVVGAEAGADLREYRRPHARQRQQGSAQHSPRRWCGKPIGVYHLVRQYTIKREDVAYTL